MSDIERIESYSPQNPRAYILGYKLGEFAIENRSAEATALFPAIGERIIGDLARGFTLAALVAKSEIHLRKVIDSLRETKDE